MIQLKRFKQIDTYRGLRRKSSNTTKYCSKDRNKTEFRKYRWRWSNESKRQRPKSTRTENCPCLCLLICWNFFFFCVEDNTYSVFIINQCSISFPLMIMIYNFLRKCAFCFLKKCWKACMSLTSINEFCFDKAKCLHLGLWALSVLIELLTKLVKSLKFKQK